MLLQTDEIKKYHVEITVKITVKITAAEREAVIAYQAMSTLGKSRNERMIASHLLIN